MFVVNEDNSIYATRGDIVFFSVSAEDTLTGVKHTFQAGDVVRIKIYGKKDAENVVLQKDFPVMNNTSEVEIYLTEEDTKIGDVISKATDYWYEVELNPNEAPQTIIGYDEDGAKIFKLFPEGDDIENYVPDPKDFPVVDEELDLTSPRPVANMAIARAYKNLEMAYETIHEAVSKVNVTPQMFGAVGDGVADDTEAIQNAIDYCQENSCKLAFMSGATYLVSTITFTKPVDVDFNGATIVSEADDFAVKFDCADTPEKRHIITNAKIKAVKGLYLRCNLMTVQDISIECTSLGLETSDCYELCLHNIKVWGNGTTGTVGYDLHCTDSMIVFCTATNIAKAFVLHNATNYIYSLHGWNSTPITGSTMMELTADRECVLNDIYCDCLENGIVADCPKVTINNFVYSFLKSLGGENKTLAAFNVVDGDVEVNGGYINFTGDSNKFTLANKFITIKNVEDRAGVCGFSYTGEDGTVLKINYENGNQFIEIDIVKDMALNLNYVCKFDSLFFPTKNYSGYAEVTEVVDGVTYTLNIPVVFKFNAGTGGMYLYLYHDRALKNAHLKSVL